MFGLSYPESFGCLAPTFFISTPDCRPWHSVALQLALALQKTRCQVKKLNPWNEKFKVADYRL